MEGRREIEEEFGEAEAEAVEVFTNLAVQSGANRTRWNEIIRRLLTAMAAGLDDGLVRVIMNELEGLYLTVLTQVRIYHVD